VSPRVLVVVLDGVGVGALPDAGRYGDEGANTLRNVLAAASPRLPNLAALGLLHTLYGDGTNGLPAPSGAFGRLAASAPGKDTPSGHWELMGLPVAEPFPTYPDGFPADVLEGFEAAIGRKTLGNRAASGTVLLDDLGPEHVRTGRPIVYTSSDSVFQVAAHEEIVPVETLYAWCEAARAVLDGPHRVARVIARPFVGVPGSFRRTGRRRDLAVPPPGETLLDRLLEAGMRVLAIGKVSEVFAGRGITESIPTDSNREGVEAALEAMRDDGGDLVYANLRDFDARYGHRNDVRGFARALEELDGLVPALLGTLRRDDLLLLTADHGCDPTDVSTEHTREYAPLVAAGALVSPGTDLGSRESLSDVSATVARYLGVEPLAGRSFLDPPMG
jgi:phosphopentomutase